MITKENAKKEVERLILEFEQKVGKYKDSSEADIETRWVEELFINVLGWTKDDFSKQSKAFRGEKRGRADYAFKIGDRIVFYLEVKKLGIPLEKEADKQVISYALSKRIPFAISTNFKQMKIFCVEQENALNNVFRVFKDPRQYLENFQDLWFLSKESFEENLLLKKAEDEGRLKKRISINKPLLDDLMLVRKLISDDIEKNYSEKYEINEKDEIVQRILDRLIFIRRCEDIGISPEGISLTNITEVPGDKAFTKLKDIFKEYNNAYNGGLFATNLDSDCDKITIDGMIIKKLISFLYESKDKQYIYNFDWIDADVLGQVYEQYLGKLLEQTKSGKAKLKDGQAHKKEQGIYYTPTYIVDYIVKNTVGELLKDRKVDPTKIKVLDPACGSGSFLIKAYDYLANYIINNGDDAGQYRLDGQGPYSIKTEILKNNLYGVDLDQKAVEITKLNLLLKAAEKNRKLPREVDLHIRHGNSLISDEGISGSSAFKWQDDFKEGSFDIIIGNPPYVKLQTLDKNQVNYFYSNYKSATKHYDLYILFVEKAISLLKEGGLLGFILPSKFFNTDYGAGLRKVIAETKSLHMLIDFKDFQVFDGATTYTCLLFLKKGKNRQFEYLELVDADKLKQTKSLNQKLFKKSLQNPPKESEVWNFTSGDSGNLINKLKNIKLKLGDISKDIFQGLLTGRDKIYFVSVIKDSGNLVKIQNLHSKKEYLIEKTLLKKILKGKEIRRWKIGWKDLFVVYPYKKVDGETCLIPIKELKDKYPNTYSYLLEHKKELMSSETSEAVDETNWYRFRRARSIDQFENPKIITQVLASKNSFTFDEKGEYYFVGGGNAGGFGLVLKETYSKDWYFILSLLNSTLLEFYLKRISTPFQGGYYSYGKKFIEKLPIVIPSEKERAKLSELSKKQLEKNNKLQEFGDKNTSETAKLKEEIEKTDVEINQLVYEFYGLKPEEIKIVEENLR